MNSINNINRYFLKNIQDRLEQNEISRINIEKGNICVELMAADKKHATEIVRKILQTEEVQAEWVMMDRFPMLIVYTMHTKWATFTFSTGSVYLNWGTCR